MPSIRSTFIGALGALALSAGAMSGSAMAETWRCYTYNPSPTAPTYVAMVAAMEKLKAATDGRIEPKCSVAGALPIDANSIVPAVGQGVLEYALSGFTSGVVPLAGLMGLPGLFASPEEIDRGFEVIRPALTAEFARHNVELLGYYVYPRQVIWSKGEIADIHALKGKSMRVMTQEQSEFIKAFGGVPIAIGSAEVATSLERGVIQGALTAASGGGRLWIDMLDHVLNTGPNFTVSYIIANKSKFDALSPEEQTALREATDVAAKEMTEKLFGENQELTDGWVEKGALKVVDSSEAQEKEMVESMTDFWDKWAKERGDLAVEQLAKLREVLGR